MELYRNDEYRIEFDWPDNKHTFFKLAHGWSETAQTAQELENERERHLKTMRTLDDTREELSATVEELEKLREHVALLQKVNGEINDERDALKAHFDPRPRLNMNSVTKRRRRNVTHASIRRSAPQSI